MTNISVSFGQNNNSFLGGVKPTGVVNIGTLASWLLRMLGPKDASVFAPVAASHTRIRSS
jgi:hypothetical protein